MNLSKITTETKFGQLFSQWPGIAMELAPPDYQGQKFASKKLFIMSGIADDQLFFFVDSPANDLPQAIAFHPEIFPFVQVTQFFQEVMPPAGFPYHGFDVVRSLLYNPYFHLIFPDGTYIQNMNGELLAGSVAMDRGMHPGYCNIANNYASYGRRNRGEDHYSATMGGMQMALVDLVTLRHQTKAYRIGRPISTGEKHWLMYYQDGEMLDIRVVDSEIHDLDLTIEDTESVG